MALLNHMPSLHYQAYRITSKLVPYYLSIQVYLHDVEYKATRNLAAFRPPYRRDLRMHVLPYC